MGLRAGLTADPLGTCPPPVAIGAGWVLPGRTPREPPQRGHPNSDSAWLHLNPTNMNLPHTDCHLTGAESSYSTLSPGRMDDTAPVPFFCLSGVVRWAARVRCFHLSSEGGGLCLLATRFRFESHTSSPSCLLPRPPPTELLSSSSTEQRPRPVFSPSSARVAFLFSLAGLEVVFQIGSKYH